ncbi:inner nuclear membrane protein enriched at telomere/subtelomere region [Marasmius sp. AFHP31]|nr:inner nuclear membrane protein enriched at telomere/subtelomere region [Marasmius sp. AFHP31]
MAMPPSHSKGPGFSLNTILWPKFPPLSMSHFTASQVIALGAYLEPDFEPSTLTIAHILGILNYHSIPYPSSYTKLVLVQIFNEEIKKRATRFKKERTKRVTLVDETSGSDEDVEEETLQARRPNSDYSLLPIVLLQNSASPVHQAPPEEGGWVNNLNLFQSGSESPSPKRPSKQTPRSSVKSRKSNSATPRLSLPREYTTPSRSTSQPDIPTFLTPYSGRGTKQPTSLPTPPSPPILDPSTSVRPLQPDKNFIGNDDQPVEMGVDVDQAHKESSNNVTKQIPMVVRLTIYLIAVLCFFVVFHHKVESASIGFCDPGSRTNARLEELKSYRAAVESCNAENRTHLYTNDLNSPPCPLLPILPLLHACTPCPENAVCAGRIVDCEKPYILEMFPRFFALHPEEIDNPPKDSTQKGRLFNGIVWRIIHHLTDGWPGLGSVGLVPSCVEDPRRILYVASLGEAIEKTLALKMGTRLCYPEAARAGEKDESYEALKWGISVRELQGWFRRSWEIHDFDDIFQRAVRMVAQQSDISIRKDLRGEQYLAHKSPTFTWYCQIRVWSQKFWEDWGWTAFGMLPLIACVMVARPIRARRQVDAEHTARLVQVSLDMLRHQTLAHTAGSPAVPEPYLSSTQLRDLVLRGEHDVQERKRLWRKVEAIIEGNANVRITEEVDGGDQMRVWQWVGVTGSSAGSPGRHTR